MKDLAIYGAGGFGREMAVMVHQINQGSPTWNLVGFFDDGIEPGTLVDDLPVLGDMEGAIGYKGSLVLAVANPLTRRTIAQRLSKVSIDFPVLIHPAAVMGHYGNRLGKGTIVTAGSVLTTNIKCGDFVIVNLLSSIGHDVTIGHFATIMPGCSVSGMVEIGEGCLLGTGSRILQQVKIGLDSTVGAGAVVTKSFPSNSKIIGVPGRLFHEP